MAPRALTDLEKQKQREKLIQCGKELLLAQGIRKTSIDDVVRAADMAKGTFYQHFLNKEDFIIYLIWEVHRTLFEEVRQLIGNSTTEELPEKIRSLIISLFHSPEQLFFLKNHEDLHAVISIFPQGEMKSLKDMESASFEEMLKMARIDTEIVKPGVVHNYVHAIYFMMGTDLMMEEEIPDTFELMLEGLITYIFQGIET